MKEIRCVINNMIVDSTRSEKSCSTPATYYSLEFMNSNEILGDLCLTQDAKREVFASLTSDPCVVPNAPTLRQCTVVYMGDVLRALKSFDSRKEEEGTSKYSIRPLKMDSIRIHAQMNTVMLQKLIDDGDDDDPPPCPVITDLHPIDPLSCGEEGDPMLSVAA